MSTTKHCLSMLFFFSQKKTFSLSFTLSCSQNHAITSSFPVAVLTKFPMLNLLYGFCISLSHLAALKLWAQSVQMLNKAGRCGNFFSLVAWFVDKYWHMHVFVYIRKGGHMTKCGLGPRPWKTGSELNVKQNSYRASTVYVPTVCFSDPFAFEFWQHLFFGNFKKKREHFWFKISS